MVPRPSSTAAVLFVLLGTGLLANPIYLHAADSGDIILNVEPISPADGAATLSSETEHSNDLPPVARYAVRQALANESFTVNASAPPLALQLFATEWHYLGNHQQTAVYRPTVAMGTNTTTIRLENVSLQTVEAELGVTPPGRLTETDHPKEIAWLGQESDRVVTVGEFRGSWEIRFETLLETKRLTVPNGNNASTFAPLTTDRFVAHDDRFYRVTVQETAAQVTLTLTPADNRTVLSETDVDVVTTDELPSDVRDTVTRSIQAENNYVRFSRSETNVSRLDDLDNRLIRHEATYYVLRRGHVDDINLMPLVRLIATGLGAVLLLIGVEFEWRARSGERK